MNTMYRISVLSLVVVLAACGGNDKNKELAKKKTELEELKTEQKTIDTKIDSLQAQISRLDTTTKVEKTKLVAVVPVATAQFTHYIDLKGRVDAQNITYVSPRGAGGQVRAVYVKQGDNVRKGQLLVKLDDAVAKQQIDQAKISLSLLKTNYDRRKNLWDQQIGTEMDMLKAKNDVENVEKQIEMLNEQLSMTSVYAEVNGVADQVNIRVGEFFSPASAAAVPGKPAISIVNTNDLKIVVDVPENYLGRVNVGSNLLITLPELNNDTLRSKVNVASKLINADTRSFTIESRIAANNKLRPNQLAIVRIQDYATPNAITIPIATLQSDETGKFVLVAAKENNRLVAKKKTITVGELYGDRLEVKSGLQTGDQLITEGFQGLYDGQPITTDVK
jgi:membrane fusion protein (multidrug efflux system)